MVPCFDGVRAHVADFVEGLKSNQQMRWDVRFDFIAHSTADADGGGVLIRTCSMHEDDPCEALYGQGAPSGQFFTSDVEALRRRLAEIECMGDEASLIGLDFCLDFPWRPADQCHRVVVFMSDEPLETGAAVRHQKEVLPALIDKIQQLRVMLFIVAPDSPGYHELATANRSEYEVVEVGGDGLSGVDFKEVLSYIGKSVSVSMLQQGAAPPTVQRGLFGQARWVGGSGTFRGA